MRNNQLAISLGAMYREQASTDGAASGSGTAAPAPTPAPVVIPEGMKGQVFHFRKEKIKDESGAEIEVYRHPSVTIPLPIPTKDELVAIFSDDARASEQKYILDLVSDAFYVQARDQINEYRGDDSLQTKPVSADIIDYGKLTITALANMPASERGNKIDDEDIKEFLKDYVAIMPAALQKDAAKIKAQAGILEKGLRTVKTDKKVLGVMKEILAVWAANTSNLEEHQPVYDMFENRIKKWLTTEPKNVFESII